MPKIDAFKIIADLFKVVVDFFDMAYKEGWLFYLTAGLLILTVIIVFFN